MTAEQERDDLRTAIANSVIETSPRIHPEHSRFLALTTKLIWDADPKTMLVVGQYPEQLSEFVRVLVQRAERAEAENAELRKALEPFGKA